MPVPGDEKFERFMSEDTYNERRVQEAVQIAEQGRPEEAIRLLNECLSDSSNPNTRLMAAGIAGEIMIDSGGGELTVIAGKSPLQNQIQQYAKIMVETYDQADEHVRDMLEQNGINMPNIKRIAENTLDMMQIVMQAKQLSYEGNQKAALKLIEKVISESPDTNDRLWAAGLATAILEVRGPELYSSQQALDTDLLKYGKLTLKCYDAVGQGLQRNFQNMGVDIGMLRKAVSDLEGSRSKAPQHHEAKQSGCFIATAAYGTDQHRSVLILSEFRDRVLLRNSLGRLFVKAYYFISPPLAVLVGKHSTLAWFIRTALLGPASALARRFVHNRNRE